MLRFEAHVGRPPDAVRTAWRVWSARTSPFASPAFFDAWCSAFRDREGLVVVGYRGSEPVLALPLWRARSHPELWFGLGEMRADYTEVAAASDDDALGRALWQWLATTAPCRLVKLPRIPPHSLLGRTAPPRAQRTRVLAAASSLVRSGRARYHETRAHEEHPYADRAHVEALAERLGSKDTRRKINVLRRGGELTYDVVHGKAIAPHLPALFAMHVAGFAGNGRTSQFAEPAERAFYEALVAHDELAGLVTLDLLAVSGTPVALHLGFEQAGTIYWYKPAFDLSLAKGSPGRVLLAHLYARAAETNVQCVDLLKGDEPYKTDWANQVRPTLTSTIIDRGLRDILDGVAKHVRRKMAASVRVST
ncbi:MAG TPA: GNAT family N-acetyltransferase [Kofleriaceae bacterium]|nr:GNAT family N-acetyltransferase [Kofleriaceae bacterium]